MNDEDLGCLGLGCLGVLAIIVCVIAYPFYDGYYSRNLPESELKEIDAQGYFSDQGDTKILRIRIDYRGDWIITEFSEGFIEVELAKNHTQYVRGERVIHQAPLPITNGSLAMVEFEVAEKDYNQFTAESNSNYLIRLKCKIHRVKGHRRPIKLVQAPIDFIKGLFEREQDS